MNYEKIWNQLKKDAEERILHLESKDWKGSIMWQENVSLLTKIKKLEESEKNEIQNHVIR